MASGGSPPTSPATSLNSNSMFFVSDTWPNIYIIYIPHIYIIYILHIYIIYILHIYIYVSIYIYIYIYYLSFWKAKDYSTLAVYINVYKHVTPHFWYFCYNCAVYRFVVESAPASSWLTPKLERSSISHLTSWEFKGPGMPPMPTLLGNKAYFKRILITILP